MLLPFKVKYFSDYTAARFVLSSKLPCLLCNQQQTLNTDVSGSASKTSDNWLPPLTACKSQPTSASPKFMGMWVFPLAKKTSHKLIVVPLKCLIV